MQWVLVRWVVDARTWSRKDASPKMENLLAELSLPHQLNPKWKDALRGQKWHSVRNAAVRQDQPFKALLFAALLATQHHLDHPLRTIELTNFDFNQFKLRNDGSHHTGKKMQRDEVLALSEMCLDWLGQFRPYFSI